MLCWVGWHIGESYPGSVQRMDRDLVVTGTRSRTPFSAGISHSFGHFGRQHRVAVRQHGDSRGLMPAGRPVDPAAGRRSLAIAIAARDGVRIGSGVLL